MTIKSCDQINYVDSADQLARGAEVQANHVFTTSGDANDDPTGVVEAGTSYHATVEMSFYQAQEIRNILRRNIFLAIENRENVVRMTEESDGLLMNARQFRQKARRLRTQMCLYNMLILFVFVIVMLLLLAPQIGLKLPHINRTSLISYFNKWKSAPEANEVASMAECPLLQRLRVLSEVTNSKDISFLWRLNSFVLLPRLHTTNEYWCSQILLMSATISRKKSFKKLLYLTLEPSHSNTFRRVEPAIIL